MKLFNLLIALFLFGSVANAQSTKKSKQNVIDVINAFSTAVDTRNVEALEPLLNENFRVVANRFPTDDKTSVFSKEAYLQLLKVGKIGGEKRSIDVKSVEIKAHIATAKVVFTSANVTFTTFQSFILNQQGSWQLVADMPFVEKK
jgi:hypothetical protein